MKNFPLGPSKDLLSHLKIYKIGYFLRVFAGTMICLCNSKWTQQVANRINCVLISAFFIL